MWQVCVGCDRDVHVEDDKWRPGTGEALSASGCYGEIGGPGSYETCVLKAHKYLAPNLSTAEPVYRGSCEQEFPFVPPTLRLRPLKT